MTVAGLAEHAASRRGVRRALFPKPRLAIWEAVLPLSPIEVDTLSRLSRVAFARVRESLDPRLRGRRKTDPGSQP